MLQRWSFIIKLQTREGYKYLSNSYKKIIEKVKTCLLDFKKENPFSEGFSWLKWGCNSQCGSRTKAMEPDSGSAANDEEMFYNMRNCAKSLHYDRKKTNSVNVHKYTRVDRLQRYYSADNIHHSHYTHTNPEHTHIIKKQWFHTIYTQF